MSNLRLINETTASSVSQFQIDNVFTDDFDIYKIVISMGDSATSDAWAMFRFVNASGSLVTASNYDRAILHQNSYSSFTESKSTNQTEIQYIFFDSNTGIGNGAVIYVFNPTSTSSYTFFMCQANGFYDSNGMIATKGIGVLKETASMKGFGLRRTSGSYDSITTKTYGLRVDS